MLRRLAILFALLCLMALPLAAAQEASGPDQDGGPGGGEQGGGPPPAAVVTAPVEAGSIAPSTAYVGTIYYPEVSDVTTETEGRVTSLHVEEGDHVDKGQVLVRLNTDLLQQQLASARANREAAQANLENARLEANRREKLITSGAISAQEYDEARFDRDALESQVANLRAEERRLGLLIQMAAIRAPFAGVVLDRQASRGQWISPGQPVVTLALDEKVDLTVEAPQDILANVKPGLEVEVITPLGRMQGLVFAVIPQGDVATRTFPVKVRMDNPGGLFEGMQATVRLPLAPPTEGLIVPRDAVVSPQGQTVVWLVLDGKAVPVPVKVLAYKGLQAGIQPLAPEPPLKPGMPVVVKGNERLRPGQPVAQQNAGQSAGQAAQPQQAN